MSIGVALSVLFALGWLTLFVFRVESLPAALPSYSGAERVWVQLTPLFLGTHVTLACLVLNRTPVDLPSAVLSGGSFALAIGLWFCGRVLIGPLRQRRLPEEPPLHFHFDGAFGIVRHPLYSAYLLAAAAPLLAARHAGLLLTYALCVVAIAMRALQEERRLHAQLGAEYDAYCRDVKRLVPFVW